MGLQMFARTTSAASGCVRHVLLLCLDGVQVADYDNAIRLGQDLLQKVVLDCCCVLSVFRVHVDVLFSGMQHSRVSVLEHVVPMPRKHLNAGVCSM